MFIGGEHTGWRSAVIYTFVEQVPRHGADPFAYFEWVFEKLKLTPRPKNSKPRCPPTGSKPAPPPVRPSRAGLHRCHGRQNVEKMRKVFC
jgi:hypothetical protein